jgi:sarcosine oxidase
MQSPSRADVVIVGGAIVGSAVATFLALRPDWRGRIVVVERDLSYRTSSTSLSAASIRLQFSTPLNIEISRFGVGLLKHPEEWLGIAGEPAPEVDFVEGGYLFLATAAGMATLEHNHAVQRGLDVPVVLLSPMELRARFPWMQVDDLAGASLGLSDEGWFDAYALLQAFARKARSLGVEYVPGEVVGLEREDGRLRGVHLAGGGTLEADWVVNAAGPRAAQVAAMAGLELPVHPRKRFVYHFDCRTQLGPAPLTISPTGVYFRPEGPAWISGYSPREGEPDPDALDLRVDPPARRLGRPLRGEHAGSQRHHRAPSGGRELPLRERVLGPRAAAGTRRGARSGRVDRDRALRDPRPVTPRLRAGAAPGADPRAERGLVLDRPRARRQHAPYCYDAVWP